LCVKLKQNVTATLSYPPSYLILSNSSSWRSYFWKILDIFKFFASWWSEVAWFSQFVVLQINYDVIKLQKYQLWRHFG